MLKFATDKLYKINLSKNNAKRKADDSMPIAKGDEREGNAKRNNPTELTNKKTTPLRVVFLLF